jgi:hypothetical protein
VTLQLFTEPDHSRAQQRPIFRADRQRSIGFSRSDGHDAFKTVGCAALAPKVAVQLGHMVAACGGVQTIDVLGHNR